MARGFLHDSLTISSDIDSSAITYFHRDKPIGLYTTQNNPLNRQESASVTVKSGLAERWGQNDEDELSQPFLSSIVLPASFCQSPSESRVEGDRNRNKMCRDPWDKPGGVRLFLV